MFARKKDGVYYRRCRRPVSDFDETRSRRGYGPKTKCRTPVLTVRVSTGCLGGSKGADFDRSKKRVFGQIFFSSNRTERFAMAFSQVFSQWLSSFKFFFDISKFGRLFFRRNFDPPRALGIFRVDQIQNFLSRGIKLGGVTPKPRGFQLDKSEPGENWPQRWLLWKCHVLQCISGLAGPILYNPGPEMFLHTCLTIAYSMAESITRSLGTKNWPLSRPPPPKTAVLLYLVV